MRIHFKYGFCLKSCILHTVGLWHEQSVVLSHPKTTNCCYSCKGNSVDKIKNCTKQKETTEFNPNQRKYCLGKLSNTSARQPHRLVCPSLAHIQKMKEQTAHEVVMSFNAVLEDAQTSVQITMCPRQSNIR